MLFGMNLLTLGQSELAFRHKRLSTYENLATFEEMFNRYTNIAITRFDWSGLPDSVNERFLNESLYFFGQAAFFQDPNLGYLALPCTTAGEFNIYYDPVRVNAYSFNYSRVLSNRDVEVDDEEDKPIPFVYIRANPTCSPICIGVYEYCKRVADILRSIDVCAKKMKNPYIFQCEEKERLTYENMIKNILDNEIVVLAAKNFGINKAGLDIKEFKQEPETLNVLWEAYKNMESLLHTMLGIPNIENRKRERQNVEEIMGNNMFTAMNMEMTLKELQTACENINKMFGLDIWVEAHYQEVDMQSMLYGDLEVQDGGGDDGTIYNRTTETDTNGV